MATAISPPFPCFLDTAGAPLQNGNIYVGTINTNPEIVANQISVYWDKALTILASQPIRTTGGYPSRSGTPAKVWVTNDYSVTVKDKNGILIFSDFTGAPDSASNLLAKIETVDGSGSGLISEGLQTVQITDLNFDPTVLGLAVRETRSFDTSSSPANQPSGVTATYYPFILTCIAANTFKILVYPDGVSGYILMRNYSAAAWDAWVKVGGPMVTNKVLISSGAANFTVPAGVYLLSVKVVGAGGGGGNSNAANSSGGGGGYDIPSVPSQSIVVTPAQLIAYSVAVGGAGGAAAGANPGITPAATTFGALSAPGGGGSTAVATGLPGAAPAVAGGVPGFSGGGAFSAGSTNGKGGGTGGVTQFTGLTPTKAGPGGGGCSASAAANSGGQGGDGFILIEY